MTAAVTLASMGNGPAFSAYMGNTQTITLSTLTKVIFNVEKFDTNSCFDTSNYRFTPTVAGYYQVNVLVFCDYNVSQFTGAEVHIYKNGVSVCRAAVAGVTWYGSQAVADVIYLNGSTDYIEVYGLISGGSGPQFLGGSINRSSFSAAMVRGA